MNLITFLVRFKLWQKLPMIPRTYSAEYNARDVDQDTAMLMSLTQTRSPQGVEILKRKHQVKTARELIHVLPPRKRKRHVLKRLLALLRRAESVTPYDPLASIARRHMRRGRR